MKVCNKHDIVYESNDCPVCALEDKVSDLEADIEKLQERVQDLESER